jgi:hypothetical protein
VHFLVRTNFEPTQEAPNRDIQSLLAFVFKRYLTDAGLTSVPVRVFQDLELGVLVNDLFSTPSLPNRDLNRVLSQKLFKEYPTGPHGEKQRGRAIFKELAFMISSYLTVPFENKDFFSTGEIHMVENFRFRIVRLSKEFDKMVLSDASFSI